MTKRATRMLTLVLLGSSLIFSASAGFAQAETEPPALIRIALIDPIAGESMNTYKGGDDWIDILSFEDGMSGE